MSRAPLKIVCLIVGLLAASTVVAAAALGAFNSSDTGPPPSPSDPPVAASATSGVQVSPPDQAAAFSTLQRPPTSADTKAATDPAVLDSLSTPQQLWRVNPRLGRLVSSNASGEYLMLVPGDRKLCVVAKGFPDGTSTGCKDATNAENRGVFLWGRDPRTGYNVRGVFPDGAHNVSVTYASGKHQGVSLTSLNALALVSQAEPSTISFTGKDGTQHQVEIHQPPLPGQ